MSKQRTTVVGTRSRPARGQSLYDLTADVPSHWGAIDASGVILPLADVPPRPGVIVPPTFQPEDALLDQLIWLTAAPWKAQGWQAGLPVSKTTVWIEVDPDAVDAIPWADYGPEHFTPGYLAGLNHPRFGDYHDWFVVTDPIPSSAWLSVKNLAEAGAARAAWPPMSRRLRGRRS